MICHFISCCQRCAQLTSSVIHSTKVVACPGWSRIAVGKVAGEYSSLLLWCLVALCSLHERELAVVVLEAVLQLLFLLCLTAGPSKWPLLCTVRAGQTAFPARPFVLVVGECILTSCSNNEFYLVLAEGWSWFSGTRPHHCTHENSVAHPLVLARGNILK